ncbi:MAG: hypothetical protein Kapaf2KO_02890 [Candidatus Kapaibacteriales bacterium]
MSFELESDDSGKINHGGYYYGTVIDTKTDSKSVCFFYQNGYCLFFTTGDSTSIKRGEIDFSDRMVDYKTGSGIYRVIGDEVVVEVWESDPRLGRSVDRFEGTILNNTTIRFDKKIRRFDDDETSISLLEPEFKFVSSLNKPDSSKFSFLD